MKQETERNNRRIAKSWLKRELAPFRVQIIALAVLAAFTTAFSVTFSFLMRYLVNGAADGNLDAITLYTLLLLGFLLVRIIMQTARSYASEQVCSKLTVDLRSRIYSSALRAQYSALEKYHSGDLLNRMTTDVGEVARDSVTLLPSSVGLITQAVGATVALFLLQPLLTAVLLGGAVLAGLLVALCRKRLKVLYREITEADGKNRAFIQESVSSAVTVKAYSSEGRAEQKSRGILSKYREKRTQRNLLSTGVNGLFSLLGGAATLVAVLWCGIEMMNGNCDFGSMFAIVLLLWQLECPLASISAIMPVYYARESAAERLAEIDLLPAEEIVSFDSSAVQEITCKNISFSYPEQEKIVLQNSDFYVRSGERVCIVGESGSGKSTFCKLLLCVYAPTDGEMTKTTAEGRVAYTVNDRSLYAYVPQGNYLFSGSIRENLTFFAPENTTETEMEDALEVACATFVRDLPEGLDTAIMERGGGLSEGQIQRLAIARAILSKRQILLLDEATSALDGETEQSLLQNLKAMGKTCIIVTHRPQALRLADRVYEMKEGVMQERK